MFEIILPVILLVLGMIILTFSSNKTVDHSMVLACNWSIPPIVIGLVLVFIGTDFPEIMNSVITTHDGVWYEELRAYQRAYGVDGKFRNLEIVSWDSDLGPTIEPFKPRWK